MFAKVKIAALLAVVVALLVAHASEGAGPVRFYRVEPGDTLWSIAEAHYEGDMRARVWELERRNAVEPGALQVGQRLVLP